MMDLQSCATMQDIFFNSVHSGPVETEPLRYFSSISVPGSLYVSLCEVDFKCHLRDY